MNWRETPPGVRLMACAAVAAVVFSLFAPTRGVGDPDYNDVSCVGIACGDDETQPITTPTPTPTPVIPASPAPLSPSGMVGGQRLAFLWTGDARTIEYRLTILDAGGAVAHHSSHSAAVACVPGGCQARPAMTFPPGAYRWYVTTIVDGGGEYPSALVDFTTSTARLPRLIYHSQTTGYLRAWFLDGLTKVGDAPLVAPRVWDRVVVAAGDFNRDGRGDLLWRQVNDQRALSTWEMDGLEFVDGPSFPAVSAQTRLGGSADFDGDGGQDLLLYAGSLAPAGLQFMSGPVVLRENTLPEHGDSHGGVWQIRGGGDFNGDGWPDILWRNAATAQLMVWYMHAQEKIGEAAVPLPVDTASWQIRGVADVDRDGDADILRWKYADGTSAVLLVQPQPNGTLAVTSHGLGADPDQGWRLVGFLPADGTATPPLTVNGSASRVTVAPGALVTVAVHGGPAFPWDWIAKHVAGSANTAYFDDWKYLDGTQTLPASGQSSATLTFAMPRSSGEYNFRFFKNNTYEMFAASPTVTVQSNSTVTVNGSSSPIVVNPGAVVTVQVAQGPALPWDWVGMHLYAAENNAHLINWKYLDGSQTQPQSGQSSATLTFTMPSTAGDYDFRIFENDTYVRLARSPRVTVRSLATMTVNGSSSPITVVPAAAVTVQVVNGPGFRWDWVAKHPSTAANSIHFSDWKYLDGTQTQPEAGQSSATLTFMMPGTPGPYNFRLFQNDTSVLLSTSPTVTVAAPVVTVNGSSAPITVAPGSTVTVGVAGGPAHLLDWVGRHGASAADIVHTEWRYLDGTQVPPVVGRSSATLTFPMPAAEGDYNFRFFLNDGHERMATSPTVTVRAP